MKNASRWVLLGLVMLPLLALGQTQANPAKPLSPAEKMDKLFDFWNRLDQPGFAVAVVKDGRVEYEKVFGLACQEHGAAITPATLFNTATLGQVFVGQAAVLLEKQGKLSLDDDVRKFITEIPDFGTPVKLRHLLYQTSGLRDWLAVLQLTGRDKEEITLKDVLRVVQAQKKLIFKPGERAQYSTTNYDLLAETVKRATGRPFSDWVWENVFKPLKMTRTQFRDNFRQVLDNQAFSYNFTRQEYLRGIDNLSLTGSHSLFASVAELAKWFAAVETAAAENRDLYDRMFQPGLLNNGSSSGFSCGFKVESDAGRRGVVQTGTWAGSGAVLAYYPDQKFGFVVLANWDYTPVDGFSQDIVDIYLPAPAPPPAKKSGAAEKGGIKVSADKLESYAGMYRTGPGRYFSLSRTGDQLFISFGPGQKFALTALSETEFLFDLADARIAFKKNKEGKVDHAVWKQGGTEQVAPQVVLVRPTPQELREFAGVYFNDELNLGYDLTVQGDSLQMTAPDQSRIRLAPDEKDHFFSRTAVLPMIIFHRDASNHVDGFTIDSEPVRDLKFLKQ